MILDMPMKQLFSAQEKFAACLGRKNCTPILKMRLRKEHLENSVQSGEGTLVKTEAFYLLRSGFNRMIRAKYWEVTRLATTDGQVGYGWRPATGKRAVFSP